MCTWYYKSNFLITTLSIQADYVDSMGNVTTANGVDPVQCAIDIRLRVNKQEVNISIHLSIPDMLSIAIKMGQCCIFKKYITRK